MPVYKFGECIFLTPCGAVQCTTQIGAVA